VVHADHPTLNRRVGEMLTAGERIDLLSTHSKYAPSQSAWLRPLDDLIDTSALPPRAVGMCRWDDRQICVPRNTDVRILWWRTDRMDSPPTTWDEVIASPHPFGFTGRESGLFGLYFELVVGAGGHPATAVYEHGAVNTWAAATIGALAAGAHHDVADWHYDDVDAALADGRVDLAAAWPGATRSLLDSSAGPHLAAARYPAGSQAWVSYSGCHAWAIPVTAHEPERATQVIADLLAVGDELDPVLRPVLDDTIAEAMITYPPHPRFPVVEDAGWRALRDMIRGRLTPDEAVAVVHRTAQEVLDAM
jgi:multiple sugar transport system substrate-binding protein